MAIITGEVEVWAQKLASTKFTVPTGTRPQIENAIAERFRSDKELVWEDYPEGISVEVMLYPKGWKIRRRFFTLDDENRPLLIEDKSDNTSDE
jgi:hypothetical protein